MAKKNRIVILVEGGLIQEITAEKDTEILVIDKDGDDDTYTIKDGSGEVFEATLPDISADVNPHLVEHYFKQIKEGKQ